MFGPGRQGREVRSRRSRCTACRVTHVLLPARLLLRRADEAAVIGGKGRAPLNHSSVRCLPGRDFHTQAWTSFQNATRGNATAAEDRYGMNAIHYRQQEQSLAIASGDAREGVKDTTGHASASRGSRSRDARAGDSRSGQARLLVSRRAASPCIKARLASVAVAVSPSAAGDLICGFRARAGGGRQGLVAVSATPATSPVGFKCGRGARHPSVGHTGKAGAYRARWP